MKPIKTERLSLFCETSLYYLHVFEYWNGGYCVEWVDRHTGETIRKVEYHSGTDALEEYEHMKRFYMYELVI